MNYRVNHLQVSGVKAGCVCATVLQDRRFDRPGRVSLTIGDEVVVLSGDVAAELARFLFKLDAKVELNG